MIIAVAILVLWYTAHAVLSRFVGTCTMGDTDRFVAGMVFGVPAGVIAAALLLLAQARAVWRIGFVLATGPLALLTICLWAPLAVSAGIQGHHLCGPEFDGYLVATYGWERLIPVAHVAVGGGVLVGGLRNLRRVWGAAQPGVEPDGGVRRAG